MCRLISTLRELSRRMTFEIVGLPGSSTAGVSSAAFPAFLGSLIPVLHYLSVPLRYSSYSTSDDIYHSASCIVTSLNCVIDSNLEYMCTAKWPS